MPQLGSPSAGQQRELAYVELKDPRHKASRKPRFYADGPLPITPSEEAPCRARIVGRIDSEYGPLYQLTIDEGEKKVVKLGEILDFVSAADLETFEYNQFVEEGKIFKIADDAERLEREQEEFLGTQTGKSFLARRTNVVYERPAHNEVTQSDEAGPVTDSSIARGRPRPTYKHLYKKIKIRRRRKRDPQTGELLEFSEDDDFAPIQSSSEDQDHSHHRAVVTNLELEVPKRRRRKRDKVTGVLLPLSPRNSELQMSARTNMLQPQLLTESAEFLQRSNSTISPGAFNITAPRPSSAKAFAPSGLPTAKRQRLQDEEVVHFDHTEVKDLDEAKDESIHKGLADRSIDSVAELKLAHQLNKAAPSHNDVVAVNTNSSPTLPAQSSTDSEGEDGSNALAQFLGKETTRRASTPDHIETSSEVRSSSDEDRFEIESILGHSLSNPKTHPAGIGDQPVMLYRVKWVGFDEPTWEPVSSFGSLDAVEIYHQKHGLDPPLHHLDMERDEDVVMADRTDHGTASISSNLIEAQQAISQQPLTSLTKPSAVNEVQLDDELEDGEYEIDSILAHQMSDPRTHPSELGKVPVMLFQVKWRGYEEVTWEPIESFEDSSVVTEYMKRQNSGSSKTLKTG